MVSVVVFDVDGTLVDLIPAISAGLDAALDELRRLVPAAVELTILDLQADWAAAERELPRAPMIDVRRAGFEHTVAKLGVEAPGIVERVCGVFFERRLAQTGLFEDARPALNALRPHYVLGLASNGNSNARRCGLTGQFAFEVYAHVDGVLPKPLLAFFDRIIARSGVEPDQILHVGDDLENDVLAAQRVGMRAAWVNRAGRPIPEGASPDLVVTALTELPGMLPLLGGPRPEEPTVASVETGIDT